MTGEKRQLGDIVHMIAPQPEKKHVLAGVLVSLVMHGAMVGKPAYDSWKQLKQWRNLLSIEVVDLPGAVSRRLRVDLIELTKPLYYPAGLVKPRPSDDRQEIERRREQQRRQQEAESENKQSDTTAALNGGGSTPQPDLQPQVQLIRQGVQRARTLNIGPIRDQVAAIYKAQQEGKIAIGHIRVAVNFRVREDGAFTHVRLVESSGVPEVDSAALIIVDELSQLRSLAPLQKTDSVTLQLSIGQEVELQTIAASTSEAEAAYQVSQLNGLLAAARLLSAAQKQTRTTEFLSGIEIKQDGVNIVAVARISRTEASQLLKKQLGSGT